MNHTPWMKKQKIAAQKLTRANFCKKKKHPGLVNANSKFAHQDSKPGNGLQPIRPLARRRCSGTAGPPGCRRPVLVGVEDAGPSAHHVESDARVLEHHLHHGAVLQHLHLGALLREPERLRRVGDGLSVKLNRTGALSGKSGSNTPGMER
jgi:hypothetical protein